MKKLISFFEIPASDFKRAIDFYQAVLKTTLMEVDCGETEKMAFFMEGEECVGAVSWANDFLPSAQGVLIHFNCEDIEEALSAVITKGGKVIIPKTKILAENKGYFTVFSDSEGNRIGLYAEK